MKRAFTLTDLLMGIACLAIITVLTLPLLARARHFGCGHLRCVNNLRQVGLAFRTWALDNGDQYPMQVSTNDGGTRELVGTGSVFAHFLVMSNELSTPKILFCPQEDDRLRTSATTFDSTAPAAARQMPIPFTNDNNISYFVGTDATPSSPDMLLAGDRNLRVDGVLVRRRLLNLWTNSAVEWVKPRHEKKGDIALADGSVRQLRDADLRMLLAKTGTATNRLDLP